MKPKMVLVAGGAVACLFATRVGRARYQQLTIQATRLRESRRIHLASRRAKGPAEDQQVQQRPAERARRVAEKSKPAADRGEASSATSALVPDSFGASSSGGQGG